MATRWQFLGPGGWQEFHVEQHEGIHSAWLGGRPTYNFSLAGHEYCIDLRRSVQVNVKTRTEREVRPPSWAVAELEVKAGEPPSFCSRALAELLQSAEDQEPICEVRISAVGAAIPAAAEAVAGAEAHGLGQICKVRTELAEEAAGSCPRLVTHLRSVEAVARARRKRWDKLASAVGAETQQMPKLNLLRLMVEFRKVERALRSGAPPGGLRRVLPVEDSLLEWDADVQFPEGSPLQCGLEDLATSACEVGQNHLTLRVRFPPDFPANPPEVWVRRPRLLHRTAPVTFGGRLCNPLLSTVGWEPSTSMITVFEDVQKGLLESGAEVDTTIPVLRSYLAPKKLERLKTELFPVANNFVKHGITVISPEAARPFLGDMGRLETTDKIALPFEYLEEICKCRSLETPAMFEVKSRLGRKRHCAVFDWVDGIPSMHAILPKWVMDDLCVGEGEQVQVRGIKLDLVSFVKVQPHSADFYGAVAATGREVGELLTESLSSFSALTEDTSVPIQVGDRTFSMQVVELRPKGAVRIIDADVEQHFEFRVDFEPSPDLEDEAAVRARQDRLLSEHRAQQERQEAEHRSLEERRQAARRQRYLAARDRARVAAGDDDGQVGTVEVPLKLPDGTQVRGSFRDGAPAAALFALALGSPWAEGRAPWGVQLRERAPPSRALEEGQAISKELHRSVVIVQEQVPEDADGGPEGDEEDAAGGPLKATEAAPSAAVPAPPPPPPALERNISELQRRTLQAFEAHHFLLAGLDEEEAVRRARNGEVAPPAAMSARASRKAAARPGQPRRSALYRTATEEGRRDLQVEEVMNIAGIPRDEALQALQNHDWNIELAVNAVFDGFRSGDAD